MTDKRYIVKRFAGYKIDILAILSFIILIVLIYWQVNDFEFISLDDYLYVVNNDHVHKGLSVESISWAFSLSKQGEGTNWHPLTWISHMMDYQFFGLNPGMHHLMNVFFHIVNTILLFTAMRVMTGSLWRSAFVAALFAVHPVNVDSVAWIAERKNLLSTAFWFLTMIAYFFYVRKPDITKYVLVIVPFCLGSLAKPMLMTLPFVLLLLDYWPLSRIELPKPGVGMKHWRTFCHDVTRLVIEKVPLFIISSIFIYATVLSLEYSKTIAATQITPIDLKIKNAIVSYIIYMQKMVYPIDLTVFYPFPDMVPMWQVMGSLTFIVIITTVVMINVRRYPYLIVGWLWFLGSLLPVIGIIQAGLWPAIAERWAYIPYIGLFIICVWGCADVMQNMRYQKIIIPITVLGIVSVLAVMAWRQVGYWKNDITLFSHSLAVDPDNYVAHVNLGNVYARNRAEGEAIFHYQEALRIHRNDVLALSNLGRLYNEIGEKGKSIWFYSEILHYDPSNIDAHYELGSMYAQIGRFDEAASHFSSVVRFDPSDARAYYNLGIIYTEKGDLNMSEKYFAFSAKLAPEDPEAHYSYGLVLMKKGKVRDAINQFDLALKLNPDLSEAKRYRELAHTHQDKLTQNIRQLEKKKAVSPNDPVTLHRLAILYSSNNENEKALDVLFALSKVNPEQPDVCYNIACIYAKQDRVNESVQWLMRAVEKGFSDWNLLKNDSDLENIRNTSYYINLVKDH